MTLAIALLAAVLGGALYAVFFVEPALAPAAFVGFAPLLVVIGRRGPAASAPATTFLLAIVGCVVCAKICGLPVARVSWAALFLQTSVIEVWTLGAMLVFAALRRRLDWPVILLWPCVWTVAEWGWSFHSLGRLAFGLSGYTQWQSTRLLQVADLGGVLLVGAVVQIAVGAVTDVTSAILDGGWTALRQRRVQAIAAAGVLVPVAALAYGSLRIAGARPDKGPRVALVQPAVAHDLSEQHVKMVQLKQLAMVRTRLRPGDVDLVVFPENAIMRYIEDSPYLDDFRRLSATLVAQVLVGASGHTPDDRARLARGERELSFEVAGRTFLRVTNSAVLIDEGGIRARYDKLHLLPFTEEMPAQDLFNALGLLRQYQQAVYSVLGYIGLAQPGAAMTLVPLPGEAGATAFTPLCFELADARLGREARMMGARAFINPTSEGDLGPQIYMNTLAIATMRAVEHHVGLARAGNMGITAVIDPWGRLTSVLRGESGALYGDPGILIAELPLGPATPTLYARLGDWPALVALVVLLAAVATSVRRRRASSSSPA